MQKKHTSEFNNRDPPVCIQDVVEGLTYKEQQRVFETVANIPSDVKSILEVGCGDGRIINCLIDNGEQCCGLDFDVNALKSVRVPRIHATIDKLPFPDKSFDAVLCCEVLEHLPSKVLLTGLLELQRVAKEYILVTVPNNEQLKVSMTTCRSCKLRFHASGHVRSFKSETLKTLFIDFKLIKLKNCLSNQRIYPTPVVTLARLLVNNSPQPTRTAPCPRCGYFVNTNVVAPVLGHQSLRYSCWKKATQLIPAKRGGGWLIALFKRIDSEDDQVT